MKFHTNFKAMTVTTQEWQDNLDIAKEYIIVEVVNYGNLVTIIYQTQTTIVEFNLSRMSSEKLSQISESEGLPTTGKRVANIPLTKEDVLYMIDQEERDAEWEKTPRVEEVNKKWRFIKYNIDSLFENNKWRKNVFTERGIPYYKTGYRTGKKTKAQLIASLMESGRKVYEDYGFYVY